MNTQNSKFTHFMTYVDQHVTLNQRDAIAVTRSFICCYYITLIISHQVSLFADKKEEA